uniref:Uncharacterized protein n=1 Tax=Electrophorus electricus TaxID=8005 RepID=A0A4W4GMM9_ELEEL
TGSSNKTTTRVQLFIVPCRNYGGVYVGLPTDLTTVASSQSKSTRKGKPLQLLLFLTVFRGITKTNLNIQ